MAAVLESVAAGIQLVMAAVLSGLAWRAWRRVGSARMGLLAAAFVVFLLQGLVLAFALVTTRLALSTAATWALLLNAAALLVIYVGVLRP